MLNIVVCGYRAWSLQIIDELLKNNEVTIVRHFSSKEAYDEGINQLPANIDFILFLGWSWIIKTEILKKYLCIGIHPSDLPMYRGGTPIQHQIIDGIVDTKVSLMTLSDEGIDVGDIWGKEQVSLSGNQMDKVFHNIAAASVTLLNRFIHEFPDITPMKQNIKEGTYYKRRNPNDSKLSGKDFENKSLLYLYNFIRALTDPYPNAYLEDDKGNRLIFKQVEYIDAEKESK